MSTPYWFIKTWATNITFGHVTNATSEERENAVAWAKQQLGSPYQLGTSNPNPNPNDPNDNFSDCWYCSELVWAAYYNQDIKIYVSWGNYHFNASYVRALRVADNIKMYSNVPPTADAGGPYFGNVNESVYFRGYNSTDVDGMIKYYMWNFGDGTNSTERFTSHEYLTTGEYTVTLTVKDNGDATDTDTTNVIIT